MNQLHRLAVCFLAVSTFGLSVAHAQPSPQTVTARGTVFSDTNRNGTRDPGESALPNIRVSDGTTIVTTDAQGRYALPLASEDVTIFVIKPRDFSTPIDNLRLPRF